MDPQSQQQPQTPTSLDYLNSISAPAQTQTMSPKLVWAFIIGGLLLLVVVFFAITNLANSGTSPGERFLAYEYRVAQLAKITDDEAKTIKSSDLRALNGSMHTILVGAQSEAEALQSKFDIKSYKEPKKDDPKVAEFTTLSTKLDDARLNNNFDQVYAREMAYQLANIVAQLSAIKKSSGSSDVKTYTDTTTSNLNPYIDQLNELNAQA